MTNINSFVNKTDFMSFAQPWLDHLRKIEFDSLGYEYWAGIKAVTIDYIIIKGDRPKKMPYTEITSDKREVGKIRQYFQHDVKMKIPDTLGIMPIETGSVEIKISGGFTFKISKNRQMKINHARYNGQGLGNEVEEEWKNAAKKLGYTVTEFTRTDV